MSIKASRFPIYKLSATGNDFLLIDLLSTGNAARWKRDWGRKPRRHWVKQWCDRHHGLGADGMLFIEKHKSFDFAWDFYNSDGSSAEMCGNAARAVSLYVQQIRKKNKFSFLTSVGVVNATVKNAQNIEVGLPPIAESLWNQAMQWSDAELNFDFVRAGVPHVVMRVPHLEDRAALKELALTVKKLPAYVQDGTNVTFVRLVSSKQIESVTFERGVEDFTLSCGTGAVAAAHSVVRGEDGQTIEVQVPGGKLFVLWRKGQPFLKGPAKIVAEMHVCP